MAKKHGFGAVKTVSAALLLAGALWYENDTLCVRSYTLPVSQLPDNFSGMRIVQISDLHAKQFGRDNADLLAAAKRQKPDAIFLTGDLAEAGKPVSALEPFLRALSKLAPTYFVTGNHEWNLGRAEREKLFALMESFGIVRLSDSFAVLERDGRRLVIAGVDDPYGPKERKTPRTLIKEIRQTEGDACILMLSHRNTQLPMWAHLGVNAVFSGHAHGGIVRLPGLGGIFGTEHDLLPQYDAGIFEMNDTVMMLSPGLGGNRKLPLRILNRPEIGVITLTEKEET